MLLSCKKTKKIFTYSDRIVKRYDLCSSGNYQDFSFIQQCPCVNLKTKFLEISVK